MQRCFQSVQWLSNVSTWPVLFKEQGSIKVWSCLWKWIIPRTKEITGDLLKRVDVAHQTRKGYKTISKEFGLHKHSQTDCVQMEEIQDHRFLSKKWSTNKDHSKAERVTVCDVAKVPRVSSKQLKVFLTLANVNVHEPTIRRPLSNHAVHGRVARRKPLFSKKKIAQKKKITWTSQRTIGERFNGWMKPNRTYWFKWEAIMFREMNTLHSSLRILSHLWNMVEVVSWLGPVLLHLGQDSLPSLI